MAIHFCSYLVSPNNTNTFPFNFAIFAESGNKYKHETGDKTLGTDRTFYIL